MQSNQDQHGRRPFHFGGVELLCGSSHAWDVGTYTVEMNGAYTVSDGSIELPVLLYTNADGLIMLDTTLVLKPKRNGTVTAYCRPVVFELTGEVRSK